MILTPFFRVASTVIQWNWKYFTIILACLQLLQKPRYQSRHCCNSRTTALANITFFVLLNNTQYSRFSLKPAILFTSTFILQKSRTQSSALSSYRLVRLCLSALSLVCSVQCDQKVHSVYYAQLSALSLVWWFKQKLTKNSQQTNRGQTLI